MSTSRIEVAGVSVSPHHYINGQRVAADQTFELFSPIDLAKSVWRVHVFLYTKRWRRSSLSSCAAMWRSWWLATRATKARKWGR